MSRPNVVVICCLTVLVASVSAGWWRAAHAPSPPLVRSEPQTAMPVPRELTEVAAVRYRNTELEARVAALEEAASKNPGATAPVEDPGALPPEEQAPPTATEMLQRHQDAIDQHRAERLNREWAETTAAAYTADYSKKSDNTTYTVRNVDCRSTTCTVDFEWPSRDAAVAEWRHTIMQPTQANCGRRIVIPDAVPGESGPIHATLIADCSTWVEEGSHFAQQ